MAVNESQKRSPQAWKKWRASGAVSPGFSVEKHVPPFVLVKPLQSVSVKQVLRGLRERGLRPATSEELSAFITARPQGIPTTGMVRINWGRHNNDFGSVSFSSD